MNVYGAQSMVQPLRSVLLHGPSDSVRQASAAEWNYSAPVDAVNAQAEHRTFARLLQSLGVEVTRLPESLDDLPDAVFTHDASLVTRGGAVLARMGKTLRRGEEAAHERAYRILDIPVLGRIEPPGTLESGDCVWVDENTVLVGCGFRTNRSGVEQLTSLLKPLGVQVISYDLPVWNGRESCLHLMSLVSMLDRDLALVFSRALPVGLFEELTARGVRMLEAPPEEFERSRTISANVLALAPRKCVMVEGYPETEALLRSAGCQITTFAGQELCIKMEGGPTCLTRPVLRG